MAQLKGGSSITGDATVSGNIYTNGQTTSLHTKMQNNYNKIVNMLGTQHTIPLTYTMKNGSTNNVTSTANGYLLGNSLRLHFDITLQTAASGNVDNIHLLTIRFQHGGKLASGYNVALGDYGYGGQVAMYTQNIQANDTVGSTDVYIAATINSTTRVNSYFVIPFLLDMAYF